MKYLIWISGLFWLFLVYVNTGNYYKDYPIWADTITAFHGFYTAAQIVAVMAITACSI